MTLRLNILGFEIATIVLELPESTPEKVTSLDQGVKRLSRWWVNKGMK